MRQQLHLRVARTIAASALLIAAIAALFTYQRTYSDEFFAAETRIRQLAETVQATAAISVYLDNPELADDVVKGLVKNEIVAHVELVSRRGLSVSAGVPPAAGDAAMHAIVFPLNSPFSSEAGVGELRIVPSHAVIDGNARRIAVGQTVLLLGYTALVVVLVMVVVHRTFTAPIKALVAELHQITPGDARRLHYPRGRQHDEIGILVGDTNRLLDTVQQTLDGERRLRAHVQKLERQYRMIFESASAGIFLIDGRGTLIASNAACMRILGTEIAARAGRQGEIFIEAVFAQHDQVTGLIGKMTGDAQTVSGDFALRTETVADARWVHCLFTKVRGDGEEALAIGTIVEGIFSDITERKAQEAQSQFQAEHDHLTRLLNRRSAEQRIRSSIERARGDGVVLAIFVIDLDRFKPINDQYGHDAGDRVLVEIAHRLKKALRQDDTVARIGGDEFLVAVSLGEYPDAAPSVAEKILACFKLPIDLPNDRHADIGASIGIALYPQHGEEFELLVKCADAAMYDIKKTGRNGYQVYAPAAAHAAKLAG